MRIRIDLRRSPQRLRYTDSMNAALVAGLVAAGLSSEELVGPGSFPWTFGLGGFAKPDGERTITSVTLSSPSERFGAALARLRPEAVTVRSTNGDMIDCAGGALRACPDLPDDGVPALMIGFASPFLIPMAKAGREKTRFYESLDGVDLSAAIVRGLSRRAGRDLDLAAHVDPLSMAVDLKRRQVRIRRMAGGKDLFQTAFSVPMTLHGAPGDVRFAFLAGIGAKAHAGFGCPILTR